MNYRHKWPSALFLLFAVISNSSAQPAAIPGFVSVQTTVHFDAENSDRQWSIPIKATGGHTEYILSLQPQYWAGGRIEGVDLVLKRSDSAEGTPNLLEPTGEWHGLQAYKFPAAVLAQGIEKANFGPKRSIYVRQFGLVIQIEVVAANVSKFSAGNYKLDALDLRVNVHNLVLL
jgi:hypothetical protein